jgi:DNA polymerase IV
MDERRVRKIIHIDMDTFYSSFEQRDNPDFKSRPAAVDHPAKHGVVAAARMQANHQGAMNER